MAAAMGIGSESRGKDMLRPGLYSPEATGGKGNTDSLTNENTEDQATNQKTFDDMKNYKIISDPVLRNLGIRNEEDLSDFIKKHGKTGVYDRDNIVVKKPLNDEDNKIYGPPPEPGLAPSEEKKEEPAPAAKEFTVNVDTSMIGAEKYISSDDYINKYQELDSTLQSTQLYYDQYRYMVPEESDFDTYAKTLKKLGQTINNLKSDIDTLKGQREWSRGKESQDAFNEKTKALDRKNYKSDEDYNKALITKAYEFFKNGTTEEHDAFLKNNGSTGEEGVKAWVDKLKKEIGMNEYLKFADELSAPKGIFSAGGKTLPSPDKNDGMINIAGEDIPVVAWSGQYEDLSDKVVDSYSTHRNDFNFAKFAMSNTDMENFYKPESVSELIKIDEKAEARLSGFELLMDTVLAAGAATHSFDVTTEIIEINGQKRAVIKYYDSENNFDGLNPGKNPLNLQTGVQITLDKRRETNHEFGYIYVENGKTMLVPLVYPGEKITKDNVDITYDVMKPVELPSELVKEIDDMLNEKGLYMDLPY